MGFEFGYSLDYPDALVMWEAQFGDFANGAQVIIDQFITSSEDKWKRLSGLVLLLPHGYEGQGPEHSSARLERFLAVVRRAQHPGRAADDAGADVPPAARARCCGRCASRCRDDAEEPAAPAGGDVAARRARERHVPPRARTTTTADPAKVTRVLLCTGKIYYELVEERARRKDATVAIVRIEKLYPWWPQLVAASIAQYPQLRECFWVQDEPANMGAAHVRHAAARRRCSRARRHRATSASRRAESASPATGSHKAHVHRAAADPRGRRSTRAERPSG